MNETERVGRWVSPAAVAVCRKLSELLFVSEQQELLLNHRLVFTLPVLG